VDGIVVIGGGIAGLRAALDSAKEGLSVALVENPPSLAAGSLNWKKFFRLMKAVENCE